jgi:DNA modification methylase
MIICGDCLDVIPTLENSSIDLVITSPPYFNSSHKVQPRKNTNNGFHYSMDIGEPLYVVIDMLEVIKPKLKEDGTICLNLGFSYGETGVMRPFDIVNRARTKFGYFVNDCIIWHKPNAMPLKNRLTNAYEYIFVLTKSNHLIYYTNKWTHNVWEFGISSGRENHGAMFPLQLPLKCLENFSKEKDMVLDPMVGSGTTGVACKQLNRNFIGIDINPEYCKIAEERIAEND